MKTNDKFLIDDGTKVVAISGNYRILSNSPTATINDIFEKGVIADVTGNILSPLLPIGVLLKNGYWQAPEADLKKNKLIIDSLFGFAVGDAFGVPFEFLDRKTVRNFKLDEMVGYGSHNVPPGSWSDDTSMLIATMDAISKSNGEINFDAIMNNFLRWLVKAEFTSINKTFGVGGIIYKSLVNYSKGIPALKCGGTEFMDNGNGSLMRILPGSLYCIINNLSETETVNLINDMSSITHANDISKMSCYIYTEFLRGIISGLSPQESFTRLLGIDYRKYYSQPAITAHSQILSEKFLTITDSQIKESGYVVDSLESAIYSILNTSNYEDSIKMAVNLGYDTDTVAGITGSIAGVLYGADDIPKKWLDKLKKTDYLKKIAEDFGKTVKKKSDLIGGKRI